MCAINGIAGGKGKGDEALISRMNEVTKHRGPDGSRVFFDDTFALGFNRLAIIDLSENAMQPMTDASGRYTLVFNGEIYNYKELKQELAEYPFKTESDSEVILAAYSRWGDAAFSRLNGMFALAIYDGKEKKLLVARDSAGIKPLYYYFENGRLIFSSEIKALLESGIPRKLDTEAFGHYLRLMYVPAPLTMFAGVKKLLPGHTLAFSAGNVTVAPFRGRWPEGGHAKSFSEAMHLVRKSVEDAVTRQLVSDRPVGLYLSGGIDSSVLLASAVKTHPKINSYSIGFTLTEGEESEKFNADAVLAKKTAKHFGATHHEFILSSDDVLSLFTDVARHLDEPIGNATALSQLYLARMVKPTATVVLTGDGGDEMFGGYERYRMAHIAEMYGGLVPRFLAHGKFEHIHLSGIERFQQLMFQKDGGIQRALAKGFTLPDTKSLFADEFKGSIALDLMNADEKHWLIDEALMRSDKMSMAAGVEARVPFLDLEVRALARSLPREYLVTPFATKRVLKEAFKDVLPKELLSQPKRGWFSPGAKWLRHPNFIAHAERALTPEYAPGTSMLFDFGSIRKMWEEHREKRAYHYTLLYAILAFQEWAREYKMSV
ncbi:asparagine synthase (glutamine-hydrolyzing) [Patescibacteria group bacterium]|nr:asparagine synthase (glutamine-hydrolyzing) [Patescibacteria group bacterium]